ncbi:MAG: hypothetical protein II777_05955 [Clostridia bacterium]|nr:hypothetical protein [Clostridia bacterium]
MISYIFILIFAAAAALNLIGAYKHNAALSCVSKPVLLSSLCAYVVSACFPSPDPLLVTALVLCFAGDVLLMINGDLWFAAGGVSFFAGHVLLILVFAGRLDHSDASVYVIAAASALYAAASFAVTYLIRKKTPKLLIVPMFLYLLCNGVMNAFAFAYFTQSQPETAAARLIAYAGAVMFFISDCALFLLRFGGEKKRFFKTDFFVMLTYISAVAMITFALCPPPAL